MKQFYISLLFSFFAFGQQTQFQFKGRVITKHQSPENINIINKTKGTGVVTDMFGDFEIEVSIEDHIVIGSMTVFTQNIVITEKLLSEGFFKLTLLEKNVELDEVQLTEFKTINAVSMGILSSPAKQYTKSERRLYTASTGGSLIPLDLIINSFSGRIDGLKRSNTDDVQNKLKEDIRYWFNEEYVIENLGIPEDRVESFYYYAGTDEQLRVFVKAKNKTATEFRLNDVATNFKNEYKAQILEQKK